MPSAQHERITARSSAHSAVCGSQSLTHRPLCPCCRHARLLGRIGESNSPIAVMTRPKLGGIGLPASSSSAGFGSNVSRCEGPPSMNKKITLFAFGATCGLRGRSGCVADRASSFIAAASALPCSRCASASAPKPPPARLRKSRRVAVNSWCGKIMSVDVDEFARV